MIHSLRFRLFLWLVVPLTIVASIDAWTIMRSAEDMARIVQERMLLGAARVIGEQVHLLDGVVQVDFPPAALELFASPSRDHVFYRISIEGGNVIAGYNDFMAPPAHLAPEDITYYDTELRQQAVHAVAFAQPVFSAPNRGAVVIQVGQTLEGRNILARDIWSRAIGGHLAMLGLSALILWVGLRRGLNPLLELFGQLKSRAPGALEPLSTQGMPTELHPLVRVINDYVARLDAHMSAHNRFIADASHQLRTPLTLLNTQINYAMNTHDDPARTEVLEAMNECVQHSVRLVNQLLAFDLAQTRIGHPPEQAPIDLMKVARRAIEMQAAVAVRRQIDLGFEGNGLPAMIYGSPVLLHELVANLIDNALRYTPCGGLVTVSVTPSNDHVSLGVADNGPGIAPSERENVFERFYRLDNSNSDGCGLGLSIVREIVTSSNASITLDSPREGTGLIVRVQFKRYWISSANS